MGKTEKNLDLFEMQKKKLVIYFLLFFLIYLPIDYKCFINFLENTQRELLFGVYTYQKRREKGEGLNPFWNRLKVEEFLGQFG